jgi:hypothetical protein
MPDLELEAMFFDEQATILTGMPVAFLEAIA